MTVVEELPEVEVSIPAVETPVDNESAPDLSWVWFLLPAGGGVAGSLLIHNAFKRSRRKSIELNVVQEAKNKDRSIALQTWGSYVEAHRALQDKVFELEKDWEVLFSYPAIVDSTVLQTKALHRILRTLEAVSPEAPAFLDLTVDIPNLPYPKLVADAQEAWETAWSFAQQTGLKLVPQDERRKIDQIVKLLSMARDSGGSLHERSVAYERASKLMGELHFIRVPAASIAALRAESRLMIEGTKLAVPKIPASVAKPVAVNQGAAF